MEEGLNKTWMVRKEHVKEAHKTCLLKSNKMCARGAEISSVMIVRMDNKIEKSAS